jgi:hypothetical protein
MIRFTWKIKAKATLYNCPCRTLETLETLSTGAQYRTTDHLQHLGLATTGMDRGGTTQLTIVQIQICSEFTVAEVSTGIDLPIIIRLCKCVV